MRFRRLYTILFLCIVAPAYLYPEINSEKQGWLENEIKDFVLSQYATDNTQMISVAVESVNKPMEEIPQGELTIECRKAGMLSGRTFFQVQVPENVPPVEFHVVADITRYENVAVLTRSVERHQQLTSQDYNIQTMPVNWPTSDNPVPYQAISGLQAKRTLPRGRVLMESMVETIPLVTRGEQVNMNMQDKNISISMPVICQNKGGAGDVIKVRGVLNGTFYYAKVVNHATVIFKSNKR